MHRFRLGPPGVALPCAAVRTLTYVVEALVGVACLAGVLPLWRRGTGAARIAAAALAVAGLAAVAHAVVELAR